MKLTWSKQPSEQGLARVCQGPRGAILKLDGERVGYVYATRPSGWYWVAINDTLGVTLFNSCASGRALTADLDTAKAECEDYVRKCLGMPENRGKK